MRTQRFQVSSITPRRCSHATSRPLRHRARRWACRKPGQTRHAERPPACTSACPTTRTCLSSVKHWGSTMSCPGQSPGGLESGCIRKVATGIYRDVLDSQRRKLCQYTALSVIVYACHFAQILIGVALTALGSAAGEQKAAITVLGRGEHRDSGRVGACQGAGTAREAAHG